jgi:hypothetical protein
MCEKKIGNNFYLKKHTRGYRETLSISEVTNTRMNMY